MSGHVYMLTHSGVDDVYKLGRTDRGLKRISEYKDPNVIIFMHVGDVRSCETQLLRVFRSEFIESYAEHKSTECFRGDINEMRKRFIEIALGYTQSNNRIESLSRQLDNGETSSLLDECQDPTGTPIEHYLTVCEAIKRYDVDTVTKYVTNASRYHAPVGVETIDVNHLDNVSYQGIRDLIKEHFPSFPGVNLKLPRDALQAKLIELVATHRSFKVPDRHNIPRKSLSPVPVIKEVDPSEKDAAVLSVKLIARYKETLSLCDKIMSNHYNIDDRLRIRSLLALPCYESLEVYAQLKLEQHQT